MENGMHVCGDCGFRTRVLWLLILHRELAESHGGHHHWGRVRLARFARERRDAQKARS